MEKLRTAGVLLHPTSLPGKYGIGDLGPAVFRWIDFLHDAGFGLWQVLPLGPTGFADSPYQCFSALAGNPNLISPEILVKEELLNKEDFIDMPNFSDHRVDYGEVIEWKGKLLKTAFQRFGRTQKFADEFERFKIEKKDWVDDFGLFMALKDAYDLEPWTTWKKSLRAYKPIAAAKARKKYAKEIDQHSFNQFLFFRQWGKVREYANQKGIRIIGDVPIYIAHDSADVWVNQDHFHLDKRGNPTVVAGVPPDYFSNTGQLWGNPIYRWAVQEKLGYAWWIKRIGMMLAQVDLIRLDHFRGFAAYWEIPSEEETAINGKWVPGPGKALFDSLQKGLGKLPFLAEDLGHITQDVYDLRDGYGFPGMRIMQFGLEEGEDHDYLPHNYPPNCVAYTGTHDNDTSAGWYAKADKGVKQFAGSYLNSDGEEIAWDMIKALWESQALMVIAPFQDFLGLGSEARMNLPGTTEGNWRWRVQPEMMDNKLVLKLRELNKEAERLAR